MTDNFRAKKKIKVEVTVPGEVLVNLNSLQKFFQENVANLNVTEVVEVISYYSVLSSETETSSVTVGSTDSQREYYRNAKRIVDTYKDIKDPLKCWKCGKQGYIFAEEWDSISDVSGEIPSEIPSDAKESENLFESTESHGETIGSVDSTRSVDSNHKSFSSFISEVGSVKQLPIIREFIRRNDAQDRALLSGGKRIVDPSTAEISPALKKRTRYN